MAALSGQEQRLAEAPVGKLLFSLAVPTVLAQLVNLLYNIIDRMYVGRIPEAGTKALAGLGVAFPIIMLISAFEMCIRDRCIYILKIKYLKIGKLFPTFLHLEFFQTIFFRARKA